MLPAAALCSHLHPSLSLTHRNTPQMSGGGPFYSCIHSCRREENWRTIQGPVRQREELFFNVVVVVVVVREC